MSGSGRRSAQQRPTTAGTVTAGLRRLADQIATLDAPPDGSIRHIDAETYLDPARYADEVAVLYRRLPVPVAPGCLLPAAGRYVTHDGYGVPLLLTRDRGGIARVFLNVCRHRGTRLVENTALHEGGSIVCPYHAWTYNLDGSLRGLPRPDGFPGLDKNDFGLLELHAAESGGIIWTRLDGGEFDVDAFLGELTEDFDAIGIASSHLYTRNTHDVPANWKLIMDAFLESYHVQRLHEPTIASFFADSITASDRVGVHFRNAVGRIGYTEAADVAERADLRQIVTYSYSLLPGTVIVVSPDYINVMQLYPRAVDRTLVENFMLIPEPPADDDADRHWAQSFELLDDGVFGGEDFRAAALAQQGLGAAALGELTLGAAEAGVADFHDELDRLLANPPATHG